MFLANMPIGFKYFLSIYPLFFATYFDFLSTVKLMRWWGGGCVMSADDI